MELSDGLLRRETALLQPEVRRNREALEDLLAEEFREFGRSGRSYARHEMIEALLSEAPHTIRILDFEVANLAPGVALVTYRALHETTTSLRSSLWVLRCERWQMLFHQGTKAEDAVTTATSSVKAIQKGGRRK